MADRIGKVKYKIKCIAILLHFKWECKKNEFMDKFLQYKR